MLVYGDRSETVDPRAYAEALLLRCNEIAGQLPGQTKSFAVTGALIEAGKIAQGVADIGFDSDGCERWDRPNRMCAFATRQLAMRMAILWNDWEVASEPHPFAGMLRVVADEDLPDEVTIREPEGYAFYAVYPELFMRAGPELRQSPSLRVIGLRSIGASLAPAAFPWGGIEDVVTLRPTGEPFARTVKLGGAMRDRLLAPAADGYVVVDEGPGASGSSFGAVGDWLEDAGVPPERITYMPSHAGDLGPQASERHRARWRTAKKAYAAFEDVILPRLPSWVEPLIGPLTEPLQDLSGGLSREALGVNAPAWPEQERRKYLAVTEQGRFLLKFAGLGGVGERKLERAQALVASGFTLASAGLAHGFLVEPLLSTPLIPAHAGTHTSRALRASSFPPDPPGEKQAWVPACAGMSGEKEIEQVGSYLGFRARVLQPPHGAASDDLLRTMMRRNFGLAGLPELAEGATRLPSGDRGPPCAIDGRLHAWEWRRSAEGRLIKLDALDHCEAHDLVGAQDVAWDIAGAAVEFGLSPDAAERLRRITAAEAGQAVDPRRVDFQTLAYLAFQIGWWTLAAQGREGARAQAEVDRYKGLAARWSPLA